MTPSERYNARETEPRWQRQWDEKAIFGRQERRSAPKLLRAGDVPYPSGRIHIGHVRQLHARDVIARLYAGQGHNVAAPDGLDAFGWPAENAAIEAQGGRRRRGPTTTSRDEEAAAVDRLSWTGRANSATCDPSYSSISKTVQRLPARGLAERESARINWDPVDMTVLANEQVIDGRAALGRVRSAR